MPKNYEIIDTGDQNPSHIKITQGIAKDLVYMYGKVSPREENGQFILSFVYEVVSNPNDVDCDMPTIRKLMGDILVENMQQNLKDGVLVFGKR